MSFSSVTSDLLLSILEKLGGSMADVENRYLNTTDDILYAILQKLTVGGDGGGTVTYDGSVRAAGNVALLKGDNTVHFTSDIGFTDYIVIPFAVSNIYGDVGFLISNKSSDSFDIAVLEDCVLDYAVLKKV